MYRILAASIVITSVGLTSLAFTRAYFSDTETSVSNNFTAGALDLLIESSCHYWQNDQDVGCGDGSEFGNWQLSDLGEVFKFFNFSDIKPGDYGEDTIGLRVDTNEAWVCSEITLTSSAENELTGPESEVDDDLTGPWDGELDTSLKLLVWGDDGDNVLEVDEYSQTSTLESSFESLVGDDNLYQLAVADSQANLWNQTGPVPGSQLRHIGTAWCFGEFVINPLDPGDSYDPSDNPGFRCDSSNETNITQTDSLTGDIRFSVTQARNNPDFICNAEECSVIDEVWLDEVVESQLGLRNNGDPIAVDRVDATKALAVAEGSAASGTFLSLGFGGSATFAFAQPVEDLPGADLEIHEVTNLPYPVEQAEVFVSQDGITFQSLGLIGSEPESSQLVDIAGAFDWIRFIRLVDATNPALHSAQADGFDVDGVSATNYNTCLVSTEANEVSQ